MYRGGSSIFVVVIPWFFNCSFCICQSNGFIFLRHFFFNPFFYPVMQRNKQRCNGNQCKQHQNGRMICYPFQKWMNEKIDKLKHDQ
jgi:hypothetical protein